MVISDDVDFEKLNQQGNLNRTKNPKLARKFYERALALKEKDPKSKKEELMGILHRLNLVCEDLNDEEAAKEYEKRERGINAELQFRLGEEHYRAEEFEKAVAFFHSAALLGSIKAQAQLGYLYKVGKGVPQDFKRSVEFSRKAAENGDQDGQSGLALCYLSGLGVDKNERAAVELLQLSVKKGHSPALYYLGKCYAQGIGVPKDPEVARKYYEDAIRRGVNNAKQDLKELLDQNPDLSKDESGKERYESAASFSVAAEQLRRRAAAADKEEHQVAAVDASAELLKKVAGSKYSSLITGTIHKLKS